MADISWRRSDEFSDFMAVLEFGAVDLDDGAWIIEEVLGSCLHDARFARSRWSEEKETASISNAEGILKIGHSKYNLGPPVSATSTPLGQYRDRHCKKGTFAVETNH